MGSEGERSDGRRNAVWTQLLECRLGRGDLLEVMASARAQRSARCPSTSSRGVPHTLRMELQKGKIRGPGISERIEP